MSTATEAPAAPPKRRRGQENVRDMVLSLLACLVVIVPIWLLGSSPAAEAPIRSVDPSVDVRAFAATAPGVPVPSRVPEGWTATSSTLEGASLRIGYVTPGEGYVEYAARSGDAGTFVADQTGQGTRGASLSAGGRSWQVWSSGAGAHTSLVLPGAAGTVVLGGLREAADDEQLTTLAGVLR